MSPDHPHPLRDHDASDPGDAADRLLDLYRQRDLDNLPPFDEAPPTTVEQAHLQELNTLFPHYEIFRFLERSEWGAVYQARQKRLDRPVAIKILPTEITSQPGFSKRFSSEVQSVAKLNHPNIVTIFDFGDTEGLFYLVTEFVEGRNLEQVVAGGELPPDRVLSIIPQIFDALSYAHGEHAVHGDLKPSNILIDKRGRIKIADFGLVEILRQEPGDPALTGPANQAGGRPCLAREKRDIPHHLDHRADLSSLGVVVFELLTGEFPSRPSELPSKHFQLDVKLDEVVLRVLEAKPERRYGPVRA